MPDDGEGVTRRRMLALLGGIGLSGGVLTWSASEIAREASEYSRGDQNQREYSEGRTTAAEVVSPGEETEATTVVETSDYTPHETTIEDVTTTSTPTSTETEAVYPHVEEVELYDLPARWETGEDLEIKGRAYGYDMDSVRILERRQGSIDVEVVLEEEVETDGWTGYEIATDDYEAERAGPVDYWIEAIAESNRRHSDHAAVEFFN